MEEHESRHQCIIYEGSPSLKLPVIAALIQRKLEEGYRCLYLNSTPMVAGMRSTLMAMGIDVVSEIAKARLVLSSEPVTSGGYFNVEKMRLEYGFNKCYLKQNTCAFVLDGQNCGFWIRFNSCYIFYSKKTTHLSQVGYLTILVPTFKIH